MSVRTLQRRLDVEGLVFRELVDATRLELAEGYLAARRRLYEMAREEAT